ASGAVRGHRCPQGDPECAGLDVPGELAQREAEVREPWPDHRCEGAHQRPVAGKGRLELTTATHAEPQDALRPGVAPGRRRPSFAWLGVVPFFAYAAMFLVLPAATVMVGAFKDTSGGYTFHNVASIVETSNLRQAFWESIRISLTTALIGAL